MMRVGVYTITLVLLLSSAIVMLPFHMEPVNAAAEMRLLSDTGYVDPSGNYHVVGEILNTGDEAAKYVIVNVTFYDSQNAFITDRIDLTMLNVVMAQRKSPFDVALLDAALSARVDHYAISTSFTRGDPLDASLEISAHNSYLDDDGNMHISGEIRNLASKTALNVKLVATYYNDTGRVVAAALAYLDPIERNLDPGSQRPFNILVGWDRTPYVSSYELTAESTESTVVPEFLSLKLEMAYFAILSITAVVLARCKTHRLRVLPTSNSKRKKL